MRSRTLDVNRIMKDVRHKTSILDKSLDYASDHAAAKALGVPRSTLTKWKGQADFRNRQALITSLSGMRGRTEGAKKEYDEHENAILMLAHHFPDWSAGRICKGLQLLGCKASLEDVRTVLRADRMRRGNTEDYLPAEDYGTEDDDPGEIDREVMLNTIFAGMLDRLIEERPYRVAYLATEMALNIADAGRQWAKVARSCDIDMEGFDLEAFDTQCRDSREELLKCRDLLLRKGHKMAPDNMRAETDSQENTPGMSADED